MSRFDCYYTRVLGLTELANQKARWSLRLGTSADTTYCDFDLDDDFDLDKMYSNEVEIGFL